MEDNQDKGHELLIKDLTWLLSEAQKFEFHDFKNTSHATPKMALRSYLLEYAQKVVDGQYDNDA